MATYKQHRTIAVACGLILVFELGSLAACSKATQEKTSDAVSAVASDVSVAASSIGTDISSMSSSSVVDANQDFVDKAATANMFEIKTSQAAIKTSTNKDVLAFAKMMVKDHTAAGKKLDAALAKDTTLTAPSALTDDQQKKLDDLSAKTGTDFDKAYADLQKSAHDDAVTLFSDYADNGKDDILKKFAASTLPTLKLHQEKVKNLNP